jgi:hypothetical protein
MGSHVGTVPNSTLFRFWLLLAGLGSCVSAQSSGAVAGYLPDISDPGEYAVTRQAPDPRFITSIEKIGKCPLRGAPLTTGMIRVPWQLYPQQSIAGNESGIVRMQLIFDTDWCVHKASIVQSTGYWRLDHVSLRWAMGLKWKPSTTSLVDGQPSVTFPIQWGKRADAH